MATPIFRFKDFTGDWQQRKFEEFCSIVTKQTGFDYTATIKKSLVTEASEDTLPYLQTKNFEGISISYDTDYFIPKSVAKEFPKINLDEKCLLFSIVGASVGNIGLFPGDIHCFLSGAICVSKLNDKDDADYLYHYMCSENGQSQIRTCTKGGAQATITIEDIREFGVVLPSEKERRKIGRFLSSLDGIITLHQRKCDALKDLKKGMLQKMFPKEGAKVPEFRFKGFTGDWEQRKVSELCSISTGKSNTQDKVEDGAYPFYVRSPIIERSTKYLYDEEAVLTVGDGVGTGKVFHYVNGKYDLHQRCYRMHGFTEELNAHYFYHTFSKLFYNRVMAMTAKTSVDSVRMEMIADMKIPCPHIKEQEKIGHYLDTLDNLITLHQRKCDALKELKKGMLQKMFPEAQK